MNLDKYILELRENIYIKERENIFILNSIKHFNNDCDCEKNNKKCFYTSSSSKNIIDLNKFNDIDYLKQLYKEGIFDALYNICQSITQTLRCKTGINFENIIKKIFENHNIDFNEQQYISDDGFITNDKIKNKGHKVDFIVPKADKVPIHISKYNGQIISCKTTLRERWLQDKYLKKITIITLDNVDNKMNIEKDITYIKIDSDKQNFTKWLLNLKNNNILTKMNKLNVLDLFSGCGGFSTGLEKAGYNIIAGIDIWDKAIESFNKNHNSIGICKDLTKYNPESFKKDVLEPKNINNIDIIVGGPPCQGFSIAGKRESNDPRNSLFMEYVKYLDFFQPKAFIFENVMGILSMKTENDEKSIDVIMYFLEKNYNCVINKLYASDFEVPQNRRRVIIFGIHKSLNIIPKSLKPILSVNDRIPVKNVLENKINVDLKYFLSEKALNGIKIKKEKMLRENKGFGAQFLDLEKPSYTIPARYWKDGYDALVKYSDEQIRRLTILELKRIQSFDDNYVLCGNNKDQIMQIGNAVAPRFAYYLGIHLYNQLYKSDDCITQDNITTNDSISEIDDLEKYTNLQLINICKQKNIKKYSKLNKKDLIELIKKNL